MCVFVEPEHVEEVTTVFFRLLQAKMFARKGKSQKYSPKFQRALVLRYLADCRTEDGEGFVLDAFLHLLVLPFAQSPTPPVSVAPGAAVDVDALLAEFNVGTDVHAAVPLNRQVGFLMLAESLLKVFGTRLQPHLPMMVAIMVQMAREAHALLARRDGVAPRYIRELRMIRKLSIRRLCSLYNFFNAKLLEPFASAVHAHVIGPQVASLYHECSNAVVPIPNTWSEDPKMHRMNNNGTMERWDQPEDIQELAKSTHDLIRGIIGAKHISSTMSEEKHKVSAKRAVRRQREQQELITNPKKALRRKARSHELKRDARRRKNAGIGGMPINPVELKKLHNKRREHNRKLNLMDD
ncbi:hypothetical protein PTSG_04011 [Salpingoeca rosetta]|uniref:U3 small nucleolar RNA-associated protein 20 N-terminal domain-containing protein n=1 Tax=Salpingoeca rosetta (strain ATCC 50818 / BSB-021) TaxID=946362 RepID=F2U7I6_SALR5|nr:uncharacterized protein PTSG_04011 [Salpingoeca rosetta]EGD83403.1 hypothetical protein PTSG_04011 [Salpingoeca rosetta]|eukprot:XP_004994907.1 hypothetical protein PTSG_04011 [Salpingoeca rosetta]